LCYSRRRHTRFSRDWSSDVCSSDLGALAVWTGKYTGRSPKDRFLVKNGESENTVDWGPINQPIEPEAFDKMEARVIDYLSKKERSEERRVGKECGWLWRREVSTERT